MSHRVLAVLSVMLLLAACSSSPSSPTPTTGTVLIRNRSLDTIAIYVPTPEIRDAFIAPGGTDLCLAYSQGEDVEVWIPKDTGTEGAVWPYWAVYPTGGVRPWQVTVRPDSSRPPYPLGSVEQYPDSIEPVMAATACSPTPKEQQQRSSAWVVNQTSYRLYFTLINPNGGTFNLIPAPGDSECAPLQVITYQVRSGPEDGSFFPVIDTLRAQTPTHLRVVIGNSTPPAVSYIALSVTSTTWGC